MAYATPCTTSIQRLGQFSEPLILDAELIDLCTSSQSAQISGDGETVLMPSFSNDGGVAANREASQVMQLLSAYQRRVVPILQDHGAITDKFMGDGIMATIGTDVDDIPFSRKSIEAAEAVLLDSQRWQDEEPLLAAAGITTIGIGIACGQVVFGAVGQVDRLKMTVIGSPVNTSAKLEKHNKVLNSNCIVSRNTWDNAIKEGFVARLKYEFMKTTINGIEGEKKIVILKT